MEELLPDLPALGSGVGVLGLLAWFLVRVMRQSSHDRADYRQAIAELADRHDKQIAELRQHQAEQIADLRGQVKVLREELADLRVELDRQRRLRWRAEDAAAGYRRQLGLPPAPSEEANSDGR